MVVDATVNMSVLCFEPLNSELPMPSEHPSELQRVEAAIAARGVIRGQASARGSGATIGESHVLEESVASVLTWSSSTNDSTG
eukprot:scaffold13334_cov30-Tisochrysis_lutea.AAC.2